MKKAIIVLSILLSILVVISFFGGAEYKKKTSSLEHLRKENSSLKSNLMEYNDWKTRLSNMEKTLVLVYNISKYEAHYYSIIFDDFSKKDSIPWEIYPALVRIESNFNPTVMSPAKCKGLTQVYEKTGEEIATKLGINFNEATLWNEFLNLIIGFTYFNEGLACRDSLGIDGALKNAIKRYCGGPGYAKINPSSKIYVGEYKNTVWQEYVRLSYIYKGILYDQEHGK